MSVFSWPTEAYIPSEYNPDIPAINSNMAIPFLNVCMFVSFVYYWQK